MDYDNWLMQGYDDGCDDALTDEEIDAEMEALVSDYEERCDQEATDSEYDKIDDNKQSNDERFWHGNN